MVPGCSGPVGWWWASRTLTLEGAALLVGDPVGASTVFVSDVMVLSVAVGSLSELPPCLCPAPLNFFLA